MGSGDWLKSIIIGKKNKGALLKDGKGHLSTTKTNGLKWKHKLSKDQTEQNVASSGNPGVLGMPIEDIAATQIQTAFRGFRARKTLRCLKGVARLQVFTQRPVIKNQAVTALNYVQSWSKIQGQIRTRRVNMVIEGHIKQRKHENQLKLEAKLHELEVEWCDGPETKEKIISRIQQREEAAIKRERAMAYAFCHQWRANYNQNSGQEPQESIFTNWGWSWIDRWIAVRPWEIKNPAHSISNKGQTRQATKISRNPTPSRTKTTKCDIDAKGRRSSYPAYGRIDTHIAKTKGVSSAPSKTQETSTKCE